MLPDQETELKLRLLDPSIYSRITSDASPGGALSENRKESAYDNVYYDTADRRLLSGGLALRVRTGGARAVATVKDAGTMSGGLYVRGEWNAELGTGESPAHAFARLPVGNRLSELIAGAPLVPLVKTTFKRVSVDLRFGGSVIEFAVDNGKISSGRKSVPMCEAELELKSGSITDVLRLGARLAESYPLVIEKQSKFERGLALAGLSLTQEPPAADVPGTTIREVISSSLVRDIAAVFDCQAQFLDKPGRPETAHRFRVGLRRLRALLSFARPALDAAEYARLSEKLRDLAAEYALIRELDVLWETWHGFLREHPETAGSENGLDKVLRSQRKKERARLTAAANNAPATAVLLDVWAAVSGNIWTRHADGDFNEFLGRRLKKWMSRFRSDLKAADLKNLSGAHALRILSKKLRYVTETLPAADDRAAPVTARDLKYYQNQLGRLCDASRNLQLLKELRKTNDIQPVQQDVALLLKSEKLRIKDSIVRIKKEASKL